MEPINLFIWWDWYWTPVLVHHYWNNAWTILSLISFVGIPLFAAWPLMSPRDHGTRDPITVGDISLMILIWFIVTVFAAPIALIAGFLASVLFWENWVYPGLKKFMNVTVIPGKENNSCD